MPRTACRVVAAFEEAMTIFRPTSALVRVDLPALGRPTKQAKPHFISCLGFAPVRFPIRARSSTEPCRGHRPTRPSHRHRTDREESRGPRHSAPARPVAPRPGCVLHETAISSRHGNRNGGQPQMVQVHAFSHVCAPIGVPDTSTLVGPATRERSTRQRDQLQVLRVLGVRGTPRQRHHSRCPRRPRRA